MIDPFKDEFQEDVTDEVLDDLFDPPIVTKAEPLSGTKGGMAVIRDWVYQVHRTFGYGEGPGSLATCHYAAMIGYSANLNSFRVQVSDARILREIGSNKSRFIGHSQRLVDQALLARVPKRRSERGTSYVLSLPVEVSLL